MTVQTESLLFSFAAILLLAAVFARLRLQHGSGEDYGPVQGRAYRIRAVFFWILILVGLPISVWLLRAMPYAEAAAGAQIVNATGEQWYWDLDREEVEAGVPVTFNVTSIDVNHGFGLYNEAGRLEAQVQAMPGYVNHLTHTFETPGIYRVLCLEFCGLAHHGMIAELTVTATGETDG